MEPSKQCYEEGSDEKPSQAEVSSKMFQASVTKSKGKSTKSKHADNYRGKYFEMYGSSLLLKYFNGLFLEDLQEDKYNPKDFRGKRNLS